MPCERAKENKKLNDKEYNNKDIVLKSYPQRLVLETTSGCNLNCIHCARSSTDFKVSNMSTQLLRKHLSSFLPKAHDISLFSWGEPLVNQELAAIYNWANTSPDIFILTNGLDFGPKECQTYIRQGLKYLNFSVDGASEETYNNIRKGSNFKTVIKNIENAVKFKKHSLSPHIRLVMVIMRNNVSELPALVLLGHSLGVDEIKAVHLAAYNEDMKKQCLFYHQDIANHYLDKARDIASDVGIKVTFPDNFGTKQDTKSICPRA